MRYDLFSRKSTLIIEKERQKEKEQEREVLRINRIRTGFYVERSMKERKFGRRDIQATEIVKKENWQIRKSKDLSRYEKGLTIGESDMISGFLCKSILLWLYRICFGEALLIFHHLQEEQTLMAL